MIIFLYGENYFLMAKKAQELKEKFKKDVDPSGGSIILIDGEKTTLKEINEKTAPQSLLSSKRMIIIENLFLNKTKDVFSEIKDYLEKSSSDNIILITEKSIKLGKTKKAIFVDSDFKEKALTKEPNTLFNFLAQQKFVQEFKLLSNFELANWIKNKASQQNVTISPQTAQNLVGLVGNDLWQIDNELKKLISYNKGLNKNNIDQKDIEELVKGKFDENIFALTDAISARNKNLAISLLDEQFQAGLAPNYILTMIIRQFKILIQIRQALDMGFTSQKIIKDLKLHPFIVQKGINQVRNFNITILQKIINELVEIDYKTKTGQAELKAMLMVLLNKI